MNEVEQKIVDGMLQGIANAKDGSQFAVTQTYKLFLETVLIRKQLETLVSAPRPVSPSSACEEK